MTALALVKKPGTTPGDQRTPEYWSTFASGVEQKIRRRQHAGRSARHVGEHVREFLLFRRRYVKAALGTVALALVAFVVWQRSISPEQSEYTESAVAHATSADSSRDRMNQYLRKSKALLVGIENMKTVEGRPIDLTAERKASRALVNEARYLKQQPLGLHSVQLMNDVDKILIELANTDETGGPPHVEMLRGGIRQENLLFKIRMAENSARFVNARATSN
jgi:hypothetical protein